MTRIYLSAFAFSFVIFGLVALTGPAELGAKMGAEFAGPSGIFEARGVYGGVSLGIAALTLAGGFRQSMQRPALWALVAYFGGYVLGRATSLIVGDTAGAMNWGFAGFELFGALSALAVLHLRAK